MTLGRTSSGAIKIKTDTAGGGLRAVECGCCQPQDFDPCRDCPPVVGNWTFNISGDLVEPIIGEFQHQPIICPSDNCNQNDYPPSLPPRTCGDFWDAYSQNILYQISLHRSGGNANACGWILSLSISGHFFPDELYGDPCFFSAGGTINIAGDSPFGSFPISYGISCQSFDPENPIIIFNKTTTVTVS